LAADRQATGRAGEAEAERLLLRAGMTVLDRRFRRSGGEIDLIARDGDTLVFVEVKTRSGEGYGMPAEAVGATKRARMARAALAWLQRHDALEVPCRFDVVEVIAAADGRLETRHLEDAFRIWPRG